MTWFKKKHENEQLKRLQQAEKSAIEIVTHKNATKKLIKETKAANEQLQDLLVKNGFTVKIFIAAGGKTKTNRTRKTV